MKRKHSPFLPTLFDPDEPLSEKLNIKEGQKKRDEGMEKAIANAEKENDDWTDKAYSFLLNFIANTHETFLAEDVRVDSEMKGLPVPPSKRAFGSVIVRAVKAGYIERVGYGQVKNPKAHRTPSSIWKIIKRP